MHLLSTKKVAAEAEAARPESMRAEKCMVVVLGGGWLVGGGLIG